MDFNEEVTSYIIKAPEEQQEILNKLRQLISQTVPLATEQIKWSRPVYGTKKDFCYLVSNKKHVNLGFMNFKNIKDEHGLLEGTGKNLRHIKLHSKKDIKKSVFKKMIKASSQE